MHVDTLAQCAPQVHQVPVVALGDFQNEPDLNRMGIAQHVLRCNGASARLDTDSGQLLNRCRCEVERGMVPRIDDFGQDRIICDTPDNQFVHCQLWRLRQR